MSTRLATADLVQDNSLVVGDFKKTDKQKDLTALQILHTFTMAYGGSRSGKTFLALRNIIIRACKVKSRHLVARFRFNHVKQSVVMDTLPKVMDICFPNLPKLDSMLNKSDWFMKLPNGSEIWFGGLDDKERVDKILGNEYSTIFLNECSQMSWDAVTTVMSRLAENVGLVNKMWFDCNPVGQKHWTYTVFKLGQDPDTGEPIDGYELYGNILINPIDNLENLPAHYIKMLKSLPKRKRQRFLEGKFLKDVEGALWTDDMVESAKARKFSEVIKTVIAIDPSVSHNPTSDECGIVVCSMDENRDGVVHADLSGKFTTKTWAQRAVNAYNDYNANCIVAEVNQGGDLVVDAIQNLDSTIKVVKVHASKGKFARAEPISMLYEQNRISHEKEMLELEGEMTEWVPMNTKESPNRIDALVWGLTYLIKPKPQIHIG